MSVTARAIVTIEINCKSSWNDNTSIEQVRKQAIDDATGYLNNLKQSSDGQFKMVGKPEIKIVSFEV